MNVIERCFSLSCFSVYFISDDLAIGCVSEKGKGGSSLSQSELPICQTSLQLSKFCLNYFLDKTSLATALGPVYTVG